MILVIVAVLSPRRLVVAETPSTQTNWARRRINILQSLVFLDGDFDAMVKAYVVDAAGNKTENPAEEALDIDEDEQGPKRKPITNGRRWILFREATDGRVIILPLTAGAVGRHLGLYRALEKGYYEYRVGHRDGPQERNAGPGGRDRHAGASGALPRARRSSRRAISSRSPCAKAAPKIRP